MINDFLINVVSDLVFGVVLLDHNIKKTIKNIIPENRRPKAKGNYMDEPNREPFSL